MAEFTQLADLYPIMMPRLKGINAPMLDQALQEALRQFCIDTEAFHEELPPINLVAATVNYSITPSYDCEIKRINNLWIRSATDVTNDDYGNLIDASLYKFTLPDALKLDDSIKPAAAVTDGMIVEVTLVPYPLQTGNDTFSPEFLNQWYEGIVYKAFHELMMMNGERWSNPNLAMYYEKKYLGKVTDAIAEVSLENKTILDGFSG
jgi:hypothetical protein